MLSHLTAPVKLNDTIDGLIQLLISQGDAKIVSSPSHWSFRKTHDLKGYDKVPQDIGPECQWIQTNTQYIQSGTVNDAVFALQSLIDLDIEVSYKAVNGYRIADGLDATHLECPM